VGQHDKQAPSIHERKPVRTVEERMALLVDIDLIMFLNTAMKENFYRLI
jgi:hypothetical protein